MPQDPDKPQAPKTKWNSDEDRILMAMFHQKQRREAIAARLGCSDDDVVDRYAFLLKRMEAEEEKSKKTPEDLLSHVGIEASMAEMLKDQPALEALFTLLCGKYNEQGLLLKSLSKLLTGDVDIESRLAECIYGRLLISNPEGLTDDTKTLFGQMSALIAKDINHNFLVYTKAQLHLNKITNG